LSDIDDILRRNPKAAKGLSAIKSALEALAPLRAAGIARGPKPLASPYAGRYGHVAKPNRKTTAAIKMTF
jgi:hypothetical protein